MRSAKLFEQEGVGSRSRRDDQDRRPSGRNAEWYDPTLHIIVCMMTAAGQGHVDGVVCTMPGTSVAKLTHCMVAGFYMTIATQSPKLRLPGALQPPLHKRARHSHFQHCASARAIKSETHTKLAAFLLLQALCGSTKIWTANCMAHLAATRCGNGQPRATFSQTCRSAYRITDAIQLTVRCP